ncbi:Carboxylesterase [Syncephalastrum racemosum]|uniref:Carboxylesterase n=1 Tax=Syncephalastrum racemosum TaxID=13706 RepID=A0A1X2H8R7_SYNRA|nr:Carboxylesterase [Syncephalastrum racemosum]
MPVQTTSSGELHGESHGGVDVYLGIPYAQPPVGERRFRPPEPYKSTAPRQCTVPPRAAPQASMPFDTLMSCEIDPGNQSEDCLYLNVWTPTNAADLPVLFFVHTGACMRCMHV